MCPKSITYSSMRKRSEIIFEYSPLPLFVYFSFENPKILTYLIIRISRLFFGSFSGMIFGFLLTFSIFTNTNDMYATNDLPPISYI